MARLQHQSKKHDSCSATNANRRARSRRLFLESLESRRVMATFQVTNVNDAGQGSLREAIESSNAVAGTDVIEFAIASADRRIQLQTPLPFVTDPVVIDATTQPGYIDRPLVQIDGTAISTNNTSGLYIPVGNSTIRGLSITNFTNGVFAENSGGNKFEGNFIGLAPSGVAAGNRANGIILQNSPGNVVGGSTASARNVISSNGQFGIRIQNASSSGNRIQGNFIGVDASGTSARPNSLDGVLVENATGTFIGTDGNDIDDAGEGNLISGNTGRGIRLFNASANIIAGNLIGVALTGTTALPNALSGVTLDGGSSNNRIGTNGDGSSDALEKNTISGNSVGGIQLFDGNSNIIAGNYIGTSTDGLQLVRNRAYGVHLGNSNSNRIGTNADGVSDPLELNLISGNETNAIQLANSDFNVVAGNWLGLSSDGETPIENGHSGMWIYGGSSDNLVGTNDDGVRDDVERNVISGNRFQGVAIDGSSDGAAKTEKNVVAGNFIGTDRTGMKAVANETGVFLLRGAFSNIIGTQATSRIGSAAGNVISGNQFNGVLMRYAGTIGNHVSGNLIGLSADGMHPLGNKHAGVTIAEGPVSNFVGGASPKEANTIGANENHGVWIVDGSRNNFVDGNFIGFAIDHATAMGNGVSGIAIENSSQNQIGTTVANTIAHNSQAGIAVTLNSSIRNDLSKNSIYGNVGLAIDLGNDGPTSNDADDTDVGPNQLQNSPVLMSASTTGSKIQVAGNLSSIAKTTYRIEFFEATGTTNDFDSMKYLGFSNVTTDRLGKVNWIVELNASVDVAKFIVATATATQSGTSEYSAAVPVQNALPITLSVSQGRENLGVVEATVTRGAGMVGALIVSLESSDAGLVQVPSTVEIPADASSVSFDVTVINNTIWKVNPATLITARVTGSAVGAASLSLTDDDSPWHNFDVSQDVNGGGSVTPLDALLIINLLNVARGKSVYELAQPTDGSKLFADTNNDEVISPLDALLVINQLNARGRDVGEGEGTASARSGANVLSADYVDLAMLEMERKARSNVVQSRMKR